jgi:hypothetical protein
MTTKDRVNPELIQTLELFEAATNGGVKLHDIPADRKLTRDLAEIRKANTPPIKGVGMQNLNIPGNMQIV